MKRIITFPPMYFFSCIFLVVFSYFVYPHTVIVKLPFNLAGYIPVIIGYCIMNNASDIFHKKKTTFLLEEPSAFVDEGLFRHSRNPMYLGGLILLTGLSLLFGSLTGFIAPIVFFISINFVCIPAEEKLMKKTFGNEYLIYKQKVRRWI